jgi:hypothetical protein
VLNSISVKQNFRESRVNGEFTTRKTVIGCTLSAAIHLEPLLDHISTTVQDLELLLISGQLINNGSSLESFLIIPSSAAVLIQNHY